jgi:deoxyribonuclease V
VRPIAVHPGWRTDLDTAVDLVITVTLGSRTPEPLRLARRAARIARARDEGRLC